MDLNRALYFWTTHNASIIQWLLFFICGMSMVLIFRVVVRKKTESSDIKVPDLTNIEESLKKIIEGATASKPAGEAGAAVQVANDPKLLADLQSLKASLSEKDAEIERLKSATPAATGGPDLSGKVKELEAKLAEYQILEDDIADLTRYKKENEQLKAQLAGQGSAAPTAEPVTPAPETPAPSAPVEAAAAAPAEAPAEPPPVAPAPEAAQAAPATPAPAMPGPDLVAEFQATVQEQKKVEDNDLLGEFSTEQKSS